MLKCNMELRKAGKANNNKKKKEKKRERKRMERGLIDGRKKQIPGNHIKLLRQLQFLGIFRKSILNLLTKSSGLPVPTPRASETLNVLPFQTRGSSCLPRSSNQHVPNWTIQTFIHSKPAPSHMFPDPSIQAGKFSSPEPPPHFPILVIPTLSPKPYNSPSRVYDSGPHTISISRASTVLIGSHLNSNGSLLTNPVTEKDSKPQGITLIRPFKNFFHAFYLKITVRRHTSWCQGV